MKKLTGLCFLLVYCTLLHATECVDRYFKEAHINLSLCQNYSNYNETRVLLYKARTKMLNAYIEEKIKQGLLSNNTFDIQVLDQELTFKQLQLTKSNNRCFIVVSGFASLAELKTFVDYFTRSLFKPFATSNYQQPGYSNIDKQLKQFFIDNPVNKDSTITGDGLDIWKKGVLRLTYKNDSLVYFAGTSDLKIKATSSLPVQVKNRFVLLQEDELFILQGTTIIKREKIITPIDGDYDIYESNGVVLICDGGKDNWVYKYVYAENKFYTRK